MLSFVQNDEYRNDCGTRSNRDSMGGDLSHVQPVTKGSAKCRWNKFKKKANHVAHMKRDITLPDIRDCKGIKDRDGKKACKGGV